MIALVNIARVEIDRVIFGSKRRNSRILVMLVIFQVQEYYCCFKRKLLFRDMWGSRVYFRPGMLLLNSLGKLVFQEEANLPRYLGKQCLFLTRNTLAGFPGEAI